MDLKAGASGMRHRKVEGSIARVESIRAFSAGLVVGGLLTYYALVISNWLDYKYQGSVFSASPQGIHSTLFLGLLENSSSLPKGPETGASLPGDSDGLGAGPKQDNGTPEELDNGNVDPKEPANAPPDGSEDATPAQDEGDEEEKREPKKVELHPPVETSSKESTPQSAQNNSPSFLDALGEDMGWNFTYPRLVRARAVAHSGDLLRMRQFIRKVVVERKRFNVVAVGGSVTAGFGGFFNHPKREDLQGWLRASCDWLSRTFPPEEGGGGEAEAVGVGEEGERPEPAEPAYRLINIGEYAQGPELFSSCHGMAWFNMVPEDTDLVVVEYAVNYWSGNEGKYLEELDAVMQKLMRRGRSPPAILFMNFFHWCQRDILCINGEKIADWDRRGVPEEEQDHLTIDNRTWARMAGTFSDFQRPKFNQFYVVEDMLTAVARYYGAPVISYRDALYPLLAEQIPGFNFRAMVREHDAGNHPSLAWAATGVADLLVSFFQDIIRTTFTIERMQLDSPSELEKAAEEGYLRIPPPMLLDPEAPQVRRNISKSCCWFSSVLLTPPCVASAEGWNHMHDPDSRVEKPGLITFAAGSVALIEVDSSAKGIANLEGGAVTSSKSPAFVIIHYLVSYERMGEAKVECVSGCKCTRTVLRGATREHVSVPNSAALLVSQSASCRLKITSKKGKGGEKFKILDISVSIEAELSSPST